ncbi:NAD(P)-dependent oxidoreductase [Dactylosporangium sp. AC04546]|uniref:NAD-dependent epimerase/dehydratase family protein n=1 Tax=Dactylosporangium sp. AC04546 TaxID=2862460 RepID=UPI001EDDCB50|nr:NAD(P)-dependent oxidoreductase [Dactylosporangium sp. AC04546]WVK87192.1 NAD(P)-dependent oxidoreductase [Dactylosporangium sp. AC04546]
MRGTGLRIAVTGSTGKLGAATVDRLRAGGHDVLGLDLTGPPGPGFTRVDLVDYGQALDTLLGVTARHDGLDALVHLAAIPVNGLVPDATTFHTNMTVTFNVFHAALRAGIRTVVYASSITALGFPFDAPPAYLPLDEAAPPVATNTYGLVKVLEEAMAGQLVRWRPDLSITALRFTNVTGPGEYGPFAERGHDPAYRRSLLWSYVDVRDGAEAVALALAAARPGFEVYHVAAADTGLTVPSADLVAGAFPGVAVRKALGTYETLWSIDKARAELGFEPRHLWRTELAGGPG